MEQGPIEFVTPTSRAMGRTTTILFRPFEIGKWFVLAFSAWLAVLFDGGLTGSPNAQSRFEMNADFDPIVEIEPAIDWGQENIDWVIPTAIGVLILGIIIFVVLLWISSRFKFIFLDNVVYNRAHITEPWHRFQDVGNSLFRWRLVFTLITLLTLLVVGGGAGAALYFTFDPHTEIPPIGWLAGLIGSSLLLGGLFAVIFYIAILLEDFVIPLMYKHNLPASGAWSRTLELHRVRLGSFVLYFLWRILLLVILAALLISLMLLTCCTIVCFLALTCLLALPYIGTVIALPVIVFFRSMGPEFFRQLGDDYDLWEGSPDPYSFEPGPGGPGGSPWSGTDPMPPPLQP